jgi:hypothetical protein
LDYLAYRAFKGYGKKLLSLDGKLHGQFLKHFLSITVDDKAYGLLRGNASLIAIEELVL